MFLLSERTRGIKPSDVQRLARELNPEEVGESTVLPTSSSKVEGGEESA
jgi:hypothetical protein